MGRPKKPIEEQRRLGNPGRRPLPEPVAYLPPVLVTPEPPDGLLEDGLAMWARVWPAGKVWLTPDIDFPLVEEACRLTDEIVAHRSDFRFGRLLTIPITNRTGKEIGRKLVPNPAIKSLRDAEEQRRKVLVELGFTPTARARLGLAQVKTQSKLEEMMARRQQPPAAPPAYDIDG